VDGAPVIETGAGGALQVEAAESNARNFKRSIMLTGGEGAPEVEVDGSSAAVIRG